MIVEEKAEDLDKVLDECMPGGTAIKWQIEEPIRPEIVDAINYLHRFRRCLVFVGNTSDNRRLKRKIDALCNLLIQYPRQPQSEVVWRESYDR